MNKMLSRRKLITSGLATVAGASALGVAAHLANRYGLIPPDSGGIYGVGETLTYAAQRILMSCHSLAREFNRSQISKVFPVNGEPPETDDYQRHYALQCLRARRLVEAGVRFVEITCPLTHANNSPWDQHGQIKKYHAQNALITDQPVAALIRDLKQRGLLDETIVVWAGEMGRTPHTPKVSETAGRDHHVNGYSIFLAGGGFQGGTAFGATDDFGNSVAANPLSIHDIHATILHQLGLDHERLTFRYGGRDHRLTDVHGRVVAELIPASPLAGK